MPRSVWLAMGLVSMMTAAAWAQDPVEFDAPCAFECADEAPIAAFLQEADVLTTSIGLKLKRIPAGTFLMGAPNDKNLSGSDESPQHRVTISRPFYMGIYEVTQSEYKQMMENNPSQFRSSDQQPVERVSWLDAMRFCNKLGEREGRKAYYKIEKGAKVTILGGNGFRLPTEAEWEYACRAGGEARFSFGDNEADLGEYAWFGEAYDKGKPHPVGKKLPNRWGLYDMHGNVWEWCQDWYDSDYYQKSPPVDPTGVSQAPNRVRRGGGWDDSSWSCRSAARYRSEPRYRLVNLGFRLAAASSK